MLACVTLPITLLRTGDEALSASLQQAGLWLAYACVCQFAIRLVFSRLAGPTSSFVRPRMLVLAENEMMDRAVAAATSEPLSLVPVRLGHGPAGLVELARRIAQDEPSEIVLSSRL